jgi:hypothetical protein
MKKPLGTLASVPRGFDFLGIQSLMPFSEPTPFRAGHPMCVPLGAGGRLSYSSDGHCHQDCFHHAVDPSVIVWITFLQSIRKVNR